MQFVFSLNEASEEPLYKQICDCIKAAIVEGRLKYGDRLPSSRALADSLGVSRVTASRSLDELASQGYIKLSAGSRATVSWTNKSASVAAKKFLPPLHPAEETAGEDDQSENIVQPKLSAYGRRLINFVSLEGSSDAFEELNFGAPRLADLPVHRWREMLYGSARLKNADLIPYVGESLGYPPLRKALADYLNRFRMIDCSPDQIAVSSGAEGGTDLIARILLEPGDLVGVENPGSPGVRTTFLTHAARLMPISVDSEGIVVDQLRNLDENPRLLYLTPSHQDPTGVVLSMQRRMQLLSWARETGTFIIEDDYDSEYHYGDRPVPPLWSLDEGNVVIYRYNFWRALYPLAHCGFMILPPQLVHLVARAKSLTEREVSFLEQRALTQLVDEGHLDRHIRRTKGIYAKRRAALYQAITRYLKKYCTISQASAGMHLIVRFGAQFHENQLLKLARECAVPMVSTAGHYMDSPTKNEFMLGFAHVDEDTISQTIQKFAKQLELLESPE
jgi:GntR family transcriptional regulator / MocR family aminotransferase